MLTHAPGIFLLLRPLTDDVWTNRKMGIYRDVQRTNYKGQFRSSAHLRLAILNGCGKAAGNFQIVLCPLYIVLSNINLSGIGGFFNVVDV